MNYNQTIDIMKTKKSDYDEMLEDGAINNALLYGCFGPLALVTLVVIAPFIVEMVAEAIEYMFNLK